MKLYLLRHGKADWPHWERPDDERPLTEEGITEMRVVAQALNRMKLKPQFILSSPLPRALRTAEIAADALGLAVEQAAELRPGFDLAKCRELLAGRGGADGILVGHEPDFSGLIASLTGGRVRLGKAGLAAIELEPGEVEGRLLSLFPAKALIRLYR